MYFCILNELIKDFSEIEKITKGLSTTRLCLQSCDIKEVNGTWYVDTTSFLSLQEIRQTFPHVIEHEFVRLQKNEEILIKHLVNVKET